MTAFSFEQQKIRTLIKDDEVWFVAMDISKILELKNPTAALTRLDEDQKQLVILETPIGLQRLIVIDGWGVFKLTSNCRHPKGKMLERWMTHEVFPKMWQEAMRSAKPQAGA